MSRLPRNSLLVVTYHYIRDPSQYEHPGIHPISLEAFRAQVDDLRSRFHVATPAEAEAFARGKTLVTGPSVLLTFDDGLFDHGVAAREVLDPLGIKGAFFVSTRPLTEHRAIMVHKVHWLRATTDPGAFRREFIESLPLEQRGVPQDEATRRRAAQMYVHDAPETARFKFMINFQLPPDVVEETSSAMLAARGVPESEFCASLYLSEKGIRNLVSSGHLVGCHGHDHVPFSRLDGAALEKDIEANLRYLLKITGRRPRWVSYPYGRDHALPPDTGAFCRQHGFRVGLTLVPGWNTGKVLPHRFRRITHNQLRDVA